MSSDGEHELGEIVEKQPKEEEEKEASVPVEDTTTQMETTKEPAADAPEESAVVVASAAPAEGDDDQDEDMEDAVEAEKVEKPDEDEPEEEEEEKEELSSMLEENTEDLVGETETKDEARDNDSQEDETKSEAAYSTRGRTGDHTSTDLLDTLARESELSLVREREQHVPAAIGASFLSESLTEEERRTRTRYLPDVEGFHALRKNEVKSDLALARSIISANGSTAVLNKKKRSRDDDMDGDGEEPVASEDDRSSDALRANAKVIEMGRNEYVLPPTAFVAPPLGSSSNGDGSSRGGKGLPTEVESTTAFNPPRPPESVGPKKKHRMLRWEQNPTSIEIDLANYRKTVQKTRQELKNAQNERDRIIAVDNHMRRNFFAHLQGLNDELVQLSHELSAVQQECVSSADLLTSRTRSRGAGKGSYVMRDVLTVLRTRGAEMEEKGLNFDKVEIPEQETNAGVGGVGALSFEDWDTTTKIDAKPPASGWVIPGDEVKTQYGLGKVKKVLSPDSDEDGAPLNDKSIAVAPRVAVELPFGIGYFPLSAVESQEKPSTYSDARLAQRWKGIIESAPAFGSYLDLEAMQNFLPWDESCADGDAMDVEDDQKSEATDEHKKRPRLVPFASDLIPTNVGRGSLLHQTDLIALDQKLHPGLYDGIGVLGDRNNKGVPQPVRDLEIRKERYIRAKARSLQLTNALLRQRRITKMNEKTLETSEERSSRVEALVTEMRSDLGSLKSRLDEEVHALGITDEEASKILTEYYGQVA
mmetsp:Transcript_1768/g.3882  ORF Transcript_1768/g.3882 Transcript_1768/m.3882 type:complete len:761 (-) Transcript_1768:112-2394(-)